MQVCLFVHWRHKGPNDEQRFTPMNDKHCAEFFEVDDFMFPWPTRAPNLEKDLERTKNKHESRKEEIVWKIMWLEKKTVKPPFLLLRASAGEWERPDRKRKSYSCPSSKEARKLLECFYWFALYWCGIELCFGKCVDCMAPLKPVKCSAKTAQYVDCCGQRRVHSHHVPGLTFLINAFGRKPSQTLLVPVDFLHFLKQLTWAVDLRFVFLVCLETGQ